MLILLCYLTFVSCIPTMVYNAAEEYLRDTSCHIYNALLNGKPNILTKGAEGSSIKRRGSALSHYNCDHLLGHGRDEYPFASSLEGGHNASVRCIRSIEHSRQGAMMRVFYKRHNIKENMQFKVEVLNGDTHCERFTNHESDIYEGSSSACIV